jgi:hypothetical protein
LEANICPIGWRKHGDKCYQITGSCSSHAGCSEVCSTAANGTASLACVASAGVDEFISKSFEGELQQSWAWIGMYQDEDADDAGEGWGQWANGCEPLNGYTNWKEDEPNWYGGEKEQCAFVGYEGGTAWCDATCETRAHCLCEMQVPATTASSLAVLLLPPSGIDGGTTEEYLRQSESHGGVHNYDHTGSTYSCEW